ncbi:MAG: twin-arginine translocase subunit TatC [Saprospiraceae bacterium]|nr:twin-arginine translocase subunit TatC [Saprospiraceae bacterium]
MLQGIFSRLFGKVKKPDDEFAEMSFMDHIDVLRKHLFRIALYIAIGMFVAFLNKDFLFNYIILGPLNENFPTYRIFCALSELTCIKPPKTEIFTRELSEALMIHLQASFFVGLFISSPLVIREIWEFVKPGLYEKERFATKGIVFILSFLFILGVLFGFFILAPFSMSFLASYNVSDLVKSSATLSSIIDIMIMFTFFTGLVFELPLAAYFLAKLGVVSGTFLRKYRRHAFLVLALVAAIITPPDVVSMIVVLIPLSLLYEVSILVADKTFPKELSTI